MFKQSDSRWSSLKLGDSPYTMGRYGCLTTAIAEALAKAGYDIDPGMAVQSLSSNGGYTDPNYQYGSGLLIWANVARSFPQWSWYWGSQHTYKLVQLKTPYGEHWVLLFNGVYFDPIDGSESTSLKSTYTPTGTVISAEIAPAPVVEPVQPPKEEVPVFNPGNPDAIQPPAPSTIWVELTDRVNIRTLPRLTNDDGTTTKLYELSKGSQIEIDKYQDGSEYIDQDGNTSNQWCLSHLHKLSFAKAFTKEIPKP